MCQRHFWNLPERSFRAPQNRPVLADELGARRADCYTQAHQMLDTRRVV
jgi:hypothetical protein